MNYTKTLHELHDFLGDTNYTNYHESFRWFEAIGCKLLKFLSIGANSRHFASEFV